MYVCVHPFKYERVRQTRQRENDRWEETERDKGRTGRADFYWQAAQSEVVRLPGPNPSPSPCPWKPVQSGLLKENGTFPSWFLNVPRAFSCLQVTTISDRGFQATTYYNPCIRQMSHREDGQTLVASFLHELGFRSIMAACQAWECVFFGLFWDAFIDQNQTCVWWCLSFVRLSCKSILSQNWCGSWNLVYMFQWLYHFRMWHRHFMWSVGPRQLLIRHWWCDLVHVWQIVVFIACFREEEVALECVRVHERKCAIRDAAHCALLIGTLHT